MEEKVLRFPFRRANIRRVAVYAVIVLAVAVSFTLFVRYQVSLCNEQCRFLYEPTLEENVGEEQTFVKKDVSDGGMSVSYTVQGFLGAAVEGETYSFEFSDFIERTSINGSVPTYTFTIPAELCSDEAGVVLDDLVDHRNTLQINEFIMLGITYSVDELDFWGAARFILDKFLASLGDKSVDLSDFARVTSAEYSAIDKAELVETCTQTASAENAVEVGVGVYEAVAEIMRNDALVWKDDPDISGDLLERFYQYGWFNCNTCGTACNKEGGRGLGLDPLFYVMLGAELKEQDPGFDDARALDLLALSYGVDEYGSFGEYLGSMGGVINSRSEGNYWGSEAICLPYLVGDSLGKKGTSLRVFKKMCYDLGGIKAELGNSLSGSDFSDDDFFAYVEVLLRNPSEFEDLPLIEKYDAEPTFGFAMTGVDNYVYGYEAGDQVLVRTGNYDLLMLMWDMVEGTKELGLDSVPVKSTVRKTLTSLAVKWKLGNDGTREAIDRVLVDLVEYVGGREYLLEIYDMEESDMTWETGVFERYLRSLSDVIPLWVLHPGFAEEYVTPSINGSVEDWFWGHYLDEACGKSEGGYFVNYNSTGTCLEYAVGIRSNVTESLYLLLISDAREK